MGFLSQAGAVRNRLQCEPQHPVIYRHVWHLPAHMEGLQPSLKRSRHDSSTAGSSRGQHRISRAYRARPIPAPSRAVGMGSCETKLHAVAELYLQIKAPTGAKTKKELQMKTEWTDDKVAMVLLAVAQNFRADGKTPRAEACEYAAARLLSIPTLASQLTHPSITTKHDALQQVVRFITDQNKGETE